MSGVGCQGEQRLDTETWNPTPETYVNYRRVCRPAGVAFSERRLGKSLERINRMFCGG